MRSKSKSSQLPLVLAKAYEVVWDQVAPVFEASRLIENPSFVYLIGEQDEGAIKIGVAANPIKRLRTMQTGNPRRLRIEWVLVGDRSLEHMLHRLWRPFAIKSAAHEAKVRREVAVHNHWTAVKNGTARGFSRDEATYGTEWFRPDVRESLFPVIKTAVGLQMSRLKDARGDVFFEDFGALVIEAHEEHGFHREDGWDFVGPAP